MEAREGMGRTLISLAVSYTNESYDEAAYLSLHQHLTLLHPAAARPLPQTDGGTISNPWEVHGILTQSYLEVVRGEMQEGRVVPESQMALGLLNYSQGEFERSADCWGAALSVKPDVSLLPLHRLPQSCSPDSPYRLYAGLSAVESTVSPALHRPTVAATKLTSTFLISQRSYSRQRRQARGGHRCLSSSARTQPHLHPRSLQPRSVLFVLSTLPCLSTSSDSFSLTLRPQHWHLQGGGRASLVGPVAARTIVDVRPVDSGWWVDESERGGQPELEPVGNVEEGVLLDGESPSHFSPLQSPLSTG